MTSFKEVQESIELLLSVDKDAQVVSVTTEWCYGEVESIHVYNHEQGWHDTYSYDGSTFHKLDEGLLVTVDAMCHMGGYTITLPYSKEVSLDELYERYKGEK